MGWNICLRCFIVWLQLAVVNSHRYECRRAEWGTPPTPTLPCGFLHLSQMKPGGALRCLPVFLVTPLIEKMTNLLFGLVGAMFYVASCNTVEAPFMCEQHQRRSHMSKVTCGVGRARIACSDPVKELCLHIHHPTIVWIHTSTGEEIQLLLSWRYNSSSSLPQLSSWIRTVARSVLSRRKRGLEVEFVMRKDLNSEGCVTLNWGRWAYKSTSDGLLRKLNQSLPIGRGGH